MIKNYTTEQISIINLHPSEQSVQFLLNFSKSFKVYKTKKDTAIEIFSN